MVVVVRMKREVFVSCVIFFVVLVIRVMQIHKIPDADFLLMVGQVVDKMMEKCAHFEECLHSLNCWRAGRQNLEGKKNEQTFIHLTGKGS